MLNLRAQPIQEESLAERGRFDTLFGLIYGYGAATGYGMLICAVKYLFTFTPLSIFEILYMRSLIAMCLLIPILYYNNVHPLNISKPLAPYLIVRCLSAFIGFVLEFIAAKFTDLSKIVIVFYNPFLTCLMGYLMIGERVNKHDLLSFFLGMLGIAFITDPFSSIKSPNDLIGIGIAVLSSVFFNIGFIVIRKVKKEIHSWQIVSFFTITNLIFSPICIFTDNIVRHRTSYFDFSDLNAASILFAIAVFTVFG